MDRRDVLVEKLGHLVPISVDQRDPDEFMVHVDGLVLVQGKIARGFEMQGRRPGRLRRLPSGRTRACPPSIKGGTLGALLELRDGDAKKELQTLDTMALSFSDLVNETHARATAPTARRASTSSRSGPSSTTSRATTTATATARTTRPTSTG